jgi:hypothetical protein
MNTRRLPDWEKATVELESWIARFVAGKSGTRLPVITGIFTDVALRMDV